MFEHVTILLSFVYAIALTHLLSSTTELVLAHRRVRFSGLYAAWLFNAGFTLLNNWVGLWGLSALKHWTAAEVVLQFASAIVQYFTCSTFRVSEGRDEVVDLPELYGERRPIIFSAFLALCVIASFENWWDRNNVAATSMDWFVTDLIIVPWAINLAIAGWARPRWMQWAAVISQTGLGVWFFVANGLPVGS